MTINNWRELGHGDIIYLRPDDETERAGWVFVLSVLNGEVMYRYTDETKPVHYKPVGWFIDHGSDAF